MQHVRRRDLSAAFQEDGALLVRSLSAGTGARVPPVAVGVLAFCGQPRTADEVAATFGPQAVGLYTGLVQAGLLVEPEAESATEVMFANFGGVDVHRRMLADTVRVDTYQRAIEASVRPTVADAGTGTGILAAMAARAGAERVYAIDNSDMLDGARQAFQASGLADRVTAVRGDFARVELPEPVELIVTETFGAWALAEGAAADVQALADRHLAPGGVVIPAGISLHLAPVHDAALLASVTEPFEQPALDLSHLARTATARSVTCVVPAQSLAHAGCVVATLPFPHGCVHAEGSATFDGTAGRAFPGLAAWFTLHMAPGIDLPTGPTDPPTHWKQAFFPVSIPAGDDDLTVAFELGPAPDDGRGVEVLLRFRGEQAVLRVR